MLGDVEVIIVVFFGFLDCKRNLRMNSFENLVVWILTVDSHLERFPTQAWDSHHAGQSSLLLSLVVETYEPEPLTAAGVVQNHWKRNILLIIVMEENHFQNFSSYWWMLNTVLEMIQTNKITTNASPPLVKECGGHKRYRKQETNVWSVTALKTAWISSRKGWANSLLFDDYKDLYIIFFSNYLVPLGVRMISKGADYCQIHNLFVSFGGQSWRNII